MKRNAMQRMPLALVIGSMLTSTGAFAQTQDMGTVVVTASGFEQKLTDAPASISVITEEQLRSRPYMTLIDAVRDLEGVDVGETSDKTGQKTISMRGMGSEYTLILVNGRRQNNHGDIYPNAFGGNQYNHIPPLDAIERIEVIRGPASTLYGAEAMGGVINIITKGVNDVWGGSITHSRTYQTNDQFGEDITTDVSISGPIIPGQLGLSLRGSIYNRLASQPEYANVTDPAGTVHTRTLGFGGGGKTVDNENTAAGLSLTWTPTNDQRVTFDYDRSVQTYDNTPTYNVDTGRPVYALGTLDGLDRIWSANGGNSEGSDDGLTPGNRTRANPQVGYTQEQEFTRDAWALTHNGNWSFGRSMVSLGYVATNNNGRTMPFTVAERELLLDMINATGDFANMTKAERQQAAVDTFLPRAKRTMESRQYTLDAMLDVPFDFAGSHQLVVGTQITRGELEDGVFGMESGDTHKVQESNMISLFVENSYSPIDPLTLTAGIRYDDHDMFGSHVSPRLYAVYNLTNSWTLKGGVSTGYKTPKTTDLFNGITGFGGQGTSPWAGNPDLKPETSVSTEIAAYWNHPTQNHGFNITVFKNDFEDRITSADTVQSCTVTGGVRPCVNLGEFGDLGYTTYSQKINIGEATIEGVELAGRYQILDDLLFRANYTYTDSEQNKTYNGTNDGRPLTNTAEHMANASLDWFVLPNFNLTLSAEYRADRYRDWDAVADKPLYYESYTVFHLGAGYQVNDSISVSARINNLFDQDFTEYSTKFTDNGDGTYTPVYTNHYNNVDKARNYWVSVNVVF